ncbi:MAG: hypothetical protein RSA52_06675 [Acetivibrio sp.]
MKKNLKKIMGILTLTLLVSSIPYTVKAAEKPQYKKERTTLYENTGCNGIYTYTVKNVKKGYKVKWVVSGSGKKYAKLKYGETIAKGNTSSNKITIATNREENIEDTSLALTAKVYSAKGNLLAMVKDSVKIKVQATEVTMDTSQIGEDLTSLTVGSTYDFDVNVLPANTTSDIYWAVTSTTGKDYSGEITSEGKWTPSEDGKYTVKAMAKNSKTGKTLAYHTASVTVGLSLSSVKQIDANRFSAIFNADASKKVKAEDFNIMAANGNGTIAAKGVEFSANGLMAYITTFTPFRDKTSYTITYGNNARTFTASVGEVKKAEILTENVESGKETKIEYALYDENNMNVTAAAPGTVSMNGNITNGYCTTDNKVYMYTVGKTGELTLTYKKDEVSQPIIAKKTVRCIEAVATEAISKDFTITSVKPAPDFNGASYVPVTTIAVGETGYLHFRALDKNKQEIRYTSVQYVSSDDNALIVDKDGRITPIKKGTVRVNVIAREGEKEVVHTFSINILDKRIPTSLNLSTNNVEMSNIYVSDYKEYINVTVADQYGTSIPLTNEACTIKETYNRQILATYDASNNQIVLSTQGSFVGTYNYQISMVVNGTTLVNSFNLTVKPIPSTGSMGYNISVDQPILDMKVDTDLMGNKTAAVRIQKYVGGVFAGYATCISATVEKDGLYYSNDLTEPGTKLAKFVPLTNGSSVVLTAVKLTAGGANEIGECKKAERGTYTITIQYQDSSLLTKSISTSITLTDSQSGPDIAIKSTTGSKIVGTALALVNDCVALMDGSVIYNCNVTGTNLQGDSVIIMPGQQIHIDSIAVKRIVEVSGGKKVSMYYTVNLDKTLTNRS